MSYLLWTVIWIVSTQIRARNGSVTWSWRGAGRDKWKFEVYYIFTWIGKWTGIWAASWLGMVSIQPVTSSGFFLTDGCSLVLLYVTQWKYMGAGKWVIFMLFYLFFFSSICQQRKVTTQWNIKSPRRCITKPLPTHTINIKELTKAIPTCWQCS